MRYSSKRVAVSSIFGVLIFLVELIPPPTSRFFQLFTALFITTAALTVHRPGGATYACLIAGILDAFYTGLPIAFFYSLQYVAEPLILPYLFLSCRIPLLNLK